MPDPFDRSRLQPRAGATINPQDLIEAFRNMQANGGGDFTPNLSNLGDAARNGIQRFQGMAQDMGIVDPREQRKFMISNMLEQRVRTLEKLILGNYSRDSVFSVRSTWTTGTAANGTFACRFTRGAIPVITDKTLQTGAEIEAMTAFNTGNENLSLSAGVGQSRLDPTTQNWVPYIIRREMLNPTFGMLVVGSASGTNSLILELIPLEGAVGELADDIDRLGKMLRADSASDL